MAARLLQVVVFPYRGCSFTAVTQVQIPSGTDAFGAVSSRLQADRCHGRGRGFESRRPRHSFQKSCPTFTETFEDPKGHIFVPFLVSLFRAVGRMPLRGNVI